MEIKQGSKYKIRCEVAGEFDVRNYYICNKGNAASVLFNALFNPHYHDVTNLFFLVYELPTMERGTFVDFAKMLTVEFVEMEV